LIEAFDLEDEFDVSGWLDEQMTEKNVAEVIAFIPHTAYEEQDESSEW